MAQSRALSMAPRRMLRAFAHSWLPAVLALLACKATPVSSFYYYSSSSSSSTDCNTEEGITGMFIGGGVCLGLALLCVVAGCVLGKRERQCGTMGLFLAFVFGLIGIILVVIGAVSEVCEESNFTTAAPSVTAAAVPLEDVVPASASTLIAAVVLGGLGLLFMMLMFSCLCGFQSMSGGRNDSNGLMAVGAAFLSFCFYVGSGVSLGVFSQDVVWGTDCDDVIFGVSVGVFFTLMLVTAAALYCMLVKHQDKSKVKAFGAVFLCCWVPMCAALVGSALACDAVLGNASATSVSAAGAGSAGFGTCVVPKEQLPRWCVGTNSSTDCSATCTGVPEHLAAASPDNYDSIAYYLAVDDPAAAGIVDCPQPDNFCGLWEAFAAARGETDSSSSGSGNSTLSASTNFINAGMCQTVAVPDEAMYYLKYRVQYAGAEATASHGWGMGGREGAGTPFWIQPLFAWEALQYRVDGYDGETCAEQFQMRCVPLDAAAATDTGKLATLDRFAEGVAYVPLSRNASVADEEGYNMHFSLAVARDACARDCECIGIVMATGDVITLTVSVLGVLIGVPLLLCCCTITTIWPVPACRRLGVELSNCVVRKKQSDALDEALDDQRWLTVNRMEPIPLSTLNEWVDGVPASASSSSASSADPAAAVARDVGYFLNDAKLMPRTAQEVQAELARLQANVGVATGPQQWAQLDRSFNVACLYFAARRRRAIDTLQNKAVARQLVAKFKELSSALKNSYDLMLNKKVFHDAFYTKRLRPLCARANQHAVKLLSMSAAEQAKHNAWAAAQNAKLQATPLKAGDMVVYQNDTAKVEFADAHAKTFNLKVWDATSTRTSLVANVPAADVQRTLHRQYRPRDRARYVTPHWTQDPRRYPEWPGLNAPFSHVLSCAIATARFFYPRTMVFIGQFSDMAGRYAEAEHMERLVGYFENIADLNLQSFDAQQTHPNLPAEQRELWAKTAECEKLNVEVEGGLGVHHLKIAPLKKAWRCAEKAIDRPTDSAGTPAFLTDIVRGQVMFKTIYALRAAVSALLNYDAVVVTRVKDRFARQANGGWADILITFYHEADPNQHCCEVQFVLKDLMLLRGKDLGGHDDFNKFRSSFEVLESTYNIHLLDDERCGPPCPRLVKACAKGRRGPKEGSGKTHGGKVKPLNSMQKKPSIKAIKSVVVHVDSMYQPVAAPVRPAPARPGAPAASASTVPTNIKQPSLKDRLASGGKADAIAVAIKTLHAKNFVPQAQRRRMRAEKRR